MEWCGPHCYRLLDNHVVEIWLGVREVTCSIPSQGPRQTKTLTILPAVPMSNQY